MLRRWMRIEHTMSFRSIQQRSPVLIGPEPSSGTDDPHRIQVVEKTDDGLLGGTIAWSGHNNKEIASQSTTIMVYGAQNADDIRVGGAGAWAGRKKRIIDAIHEHIKRKDGIALFYDDTKPNIFQFGKLVKGVITDQDEKTHAVYVNWTEYVQNEMIDQVKVKGPFPHLAIKDHLTTYLGPKPNPALIAFDFDRTLVSCHTGGTPDVEDFKTNGILHDRKVVDQATGSDGKTTTPKIYPKGTATVEEMAALKTFLHDLLAKGHHVIIVTRGIERDVQAVINQLMYPETKSVLLIGSLYAQVRTL